MPRKRHKADEIVTKLDTSKNRVLGGIFSMRMVGTAFSSLFVPILAVLSGGMPPLAPLPLMLRRIFRIAIQSGAYCRRGSPFQSSLSPARSRSFAQPAPWVPSDVRRHARPLNGLSTCVHSRSACVRALAYPLASFDECEIRTHGATTSPRFSLIGMPCPPRHRWPCSRITYIIFRTFLGLEGSFH